MISINEITKPCASWKRARAAWPRPRTSSRSLRNRKLTFDRADELVLGHAVQQGIYQVPGLLRRLYVRGVRLLRVIEHGLVAVGTQIDQTVFQLGQLLGVYIFGPVVDDGEEGLQGNGHNVEVVPIALLDDLDDAGDQGGPVRGLELVVGQQVDDDAQAVVNDLFGSRVQQNQHSLVELGVQDWLDELLHPGQVGDNPQALAAHLLVVDLDYEIDQGVYELLLHILVLVTGQQHLPIVVQCVGQAAQHTGDQLLN